MAEKEWFDKQVEKLASLWKKRETAYKDYEESANAPNKEIMYRYWNQDAKHYDREREKYDKRVETYARRLDLHYNTLKKELDDVQVKKTVPGKHIDRPKVVFKVWEEPSAKVNEKKRSASPAQSDHH